MENCTKNRKIILKNTMERFLKVEYNVAIYYNNNSNLVEILNQCVISF